MSWHNSCRKGFDFGYEDFDTTAHTPPEGMWRNPDFVITYQGEDVLICNNCYRQLKAFRGRDAERAFARELHVMRAKLGPNSVS